MNNYERKGYCMMKNYIDYFENQVNHNSFHIAATDENKSITYDELNKKANQLSECIRTQFSISEQSFIGIVMDHSVEMLISIFAVLKSGCAYVPMEPDFPQQRILHIMEETKISMMITRKKYSEIFKNRCPIFQWNNESFAKLDAYSDRNPALKIGGEDNCYVLYTSGSTGKPKGVLIKHENLINYIQAFQAEFNLTENDCMLQNSVCTFDIFTEEVFPILLAGGTLAIAGTNSDISSLIDFINKKNVTIVSAFPYLFIEFNKLKQIPQSLRLLISGGDVLRKEYVSNLIDKVEIYNTYGPTETTVCVSYFRCTKESFDKNTSVSIGKAILNTKIYLLDEDMKPVPKGTVGEICITGKGVSKGYLNNQKETDKYFVPSPFVENETMYKSGDLGIWNEDGNITFLKRKDKQFMIGGKRVEIMEVETVLSSYPRIKQAIVNVIHDDKEMNCLVAYLTSDNSLKRSDVIQYLDQFLPLYMIPRFIIQLKRIPLTLNGKIDRNALPSILL